MVAGNSRSAWAKLLSIVPHRGKQRRATRYHSRPGFTIISTTYVSTKTQNRNVASAAHVVTCLFQVKLWNVGC